MKLDHIGIAVENFEKAIPVFELLLNANCYKKEVVESEQVETAFFKTENCKIELLQGLNQTNAISKFVNKKGPGLHHIAFEVDNIEEKITELQNKGFEFVNNVPKLGADNKKICFLHPKSMHGVLVEFCQDLNKCNNPI
ncbi:MAG: methylmalonyl-CoA epimerase [Alphaproteobacteria bacterium]|nr:methylmalonyl-CoA epimerase [Alphaproteobacteria bacterium]